MKNIKFVFWGFLALLSLVWWGTDQSNFFDLNGVFEWRNVLNQYTGVLGMGVMSLAVMLSVRPVFLEPYLGGLDKGYRLHKWLGISALVISVSHWLIANGPKWAVDLGWLERRGRRQRPNFPEGSWEHLFAGQRGLAEAVGEWAFYAAVVLMVLALVKSFPYRGFLQTHKLLAVAYLALVFHAVVLVKFAYWRGPLGPVLAVLMALGSVAAVMSLAGKRAGGARVVGKVAAIEEQMALNVLVVDVQLERGWPGHQAGQFAFVTFHDDEGAHPFTLAAAWQDDGRVRFMIKALGDYTRTLPGRLKVGDAATLEGPYGQFNFAGDGPRQIWISGGIGITPFIARMQALAGRQGRKPVHLFHSAARDDQAFFGRLAEAAAQADVGLHVQWDEAHGRLDLGQIIRTVPDWREADFWFCGPAGFGRMLKEGLVAMGFPPERFHQELFEMR